jgi:hypothetical protein
MPLPRWKFLETFRVQETWFESLPEKEATSGISHDWG